MGKDKVKLAVQGKSKGLEIKTRETFSVNYTTRFADILQVRV